MFITCVAIFIVCILQLSLCKPNNIMGENCTDEAKDYFCEEKLIMGDFESTCYYPFKNVKDKCNFPVFQGSPMYPCRVRFLCKPLTNKKGINLQYTVLCTPQNLNLITFFQKYKTFLTKINSNFAWNSY